MERLVPVSKLKLGDRLARGIYSHSGALLVAENAVVDETILAKLKAHKVAYAVIQSDELAATAQNQGWHSFNTAYQDSVLAVDRLMQSIRHGEEADVSEVKMVAENLIRDVTERPNVLSHLLKIKSKDSYTYQHSLNVAIIAALLGTWLGYDQSTVSDLTYAGLLHDIGKSKVPLSILNKPGRLTPEEMRVVKKHSLYGYQIVQKMSGIPLQIAQAVLLHHERENGSGYPLGLTSAKIPVYAKVLAVSDVYDAITSDRVYQQRRNPFSAIDEIFAESFKHLDPHIVLTFKQHICELFVGSTVRLSNGKTGRVVLINRDAPTRPVVQAGSNYFNLSTNYSIQIEDVLDRA